jgi:hypothetical protein
MSIFNSERAYPRRRNAFTILEVMIALAIFFGCVFGILALVAQSLRSARSLRPLNMDARSAIAMISMTNRLSEGPIPPEIIFAYEKENPGFILTGEIFEAETNGLFRVVFTVGTASSGSQKQAVTMTDEILLFSPLSQQQTGLRVPRPLR